MKSDDERVFSRFDVFWREDGEDHFVVADCFVGVVCYVEGIEFGGHCEGRSLAILV